MFRLCTDNKRQQRKLLLQFGRTEMSDILRGLHRKTHRDEPRDNYHLGSRPRSLDSTAISAASRTSKRHNPSRRWHLFDRLASAYWSLRYDFRFAVLLAHGPLRLGIAIRGARFIPCVLVYLWLVIAKYRRCNQRWTEAEERGTMLDPNNTSWFVWFSQMPDWWALRGTSRLGVGFHGL